MSSKTHKSRNCSRWVLAVAVLLCDARAWAAAEPSSHASAADVLQAEGYAAQAYAAYQEKRYQDAVSLYQKAFEIAPSADALFNIARVHDVGLRRRDAAIASYERYISDPGATPELIRRARERIAELRAAEVAQRQARPPTATIAPPATTARPGSGANSVQIQDSSSGWSSWRVAAVTSGTAGAVALGVAVSHGISLRSEADLANRECVGNACSSQRGVDAARAAAHDARIASWSLGLAGGLLAGATLLWLLDPGVPPAPEPGAVELTPIANASVLGAMLSGGW